MKTHSAVRTTVRIESALLNAIRLKAASTRQTTSKVINDAVRQALGEDIEDLTAFQDRRTEPALTLVQLQASIKRRTSR